MRSASPWIILLLYLPMQARSQREIVFVSDTQQPLAIEKIIHRTHHNTLATSMIFSAILRDRPAAVYMTGDVVSVGSKKNKWRKADRFLDSCRALKIGVFALLGNHDVMWNRKNGERNFQKRFPDHSDTGYYSVTDSIAVVLLNSNFSKLSPAETEKQLRWYEAALQQLDSNKAVQAIIVSCHHAPWSNSRVVGSATAVQDHFVPPFLETRKCRLFITGHAHAFEHFRVAGKDFLVIGGGGGIHQPLDSSARRIPDLAAGYKPMFHYLSIRRSNDSLQISSHFLQTDFSGFGKGYSFSHSLSD